MKINELNGSKIWQFVVQYLETLTVWTSLGNHQKSCQITIYIGLTSFSWALPSSDKAGLTRQAGLSLAIYTIWSVQSHTPDISQNLCIFIWFQKNSFCGVWNFHIFFKHQHLFCWRPLFLFLSTKAAAVCGGDRGLLDKSYLGLKTSGTSHNVFCLIYLLLCTL